jgi:creatinine amidohydrolase
VTQENRAEIASPLLIRFNTHVSVLQSAAEEDLLMRVPVRPRLVAAIVGLLCLPLSSLKSLEAQATPSNKLSVHWEELTASDFREGIHRSQGVCLLPFGILEKHGPHLPLGTDLLDVRYAALHAAEQEYAVVFPEYYFGQIAEAKHEPGTMAYSRGMQLALLQETTDEMARNGCKKVLIVNGHGGNSSLLPYFAQTQLDKPHDYVVYVFDERTPEHGGPPKKTKIDMHAGESETSKMMISHPELVHQDRATSESGADQARQKIPEDVYTGIWWYTRFPNHYSGEGAAATKELGEYQMKWWIDSIAKAIKAVQGDDVSLKLQNEFYEKSAHPLDTQP